MNYRSRLFSVLLFSFASPILLADSNPIESRLFSGQSSGKIKKFRLTIDDAIVRKNDIGSELFVSLDSKPDKEYTVQLGSSSELSTEVITETLRYAYMQDLPVTIFHEVPLESSDRYRIFMVQIGNGAEDQKVLPAAQTTAKR